MIRRIAICPSMPDITIPNNFIGHLKSSKKHFRVALAELIDSIENTHEVIDFKVEWDFQTSVFDKNNWYIKSKDRFFFKNEDEPDFIYEILIVEVDTSRKWRIGWSEFEEFIDYFKVPELLDEELNMYD